MKKIVGFLCALIACSSSLTMGMNQSKEQRLSKNWKEWHGEEEDWQNWPRQRAHISKNWKEWHGEEENWQSWPGQHAHISKNWKEWHGEEEDWQSWPGQHAHTKFPVLEKKNISNEDIQKSLSDDPYAHVKPKSMNAGDALPHYAYTLFCLKKILTGRKDVDVRRALSLKIRYNRLRAYVFLPPQNRPHYGITSEASLMDIINNPEVTNIRGELFLQHGICSVPELTKRGEILHHVAKNLNKEWKEYKGILLLQNAIAWEINRVNKKVQNITLRLNELSNEQFLGKINPSKNLVRKKCKKLFTQNRQHSRQKKGTFFTV